MRCRTSKGRLVVRGVEQAVDVVQHDENRRIAQAQRGKAEIEQVAMVGVRV
jgi:hypothetical protein